MEIAFEAAIDADIRAGLASEGYVIDDATYREAEHWAVEHYAPSLYRAVVWRLASGDAASAQRVYDSMEAAAHKRTGLFELREGIGDVLEGLKTRGLKLGIAANQPARMLEDLERYGIGHYFESQAISAIY